PSGERAGAPPPSADGSSGVGGAPAPTPGPDRVDAAPRSADRIVLAWRPVEDASGYLIERRGELVTPGWELIATTAAGATTYVDRGLEAETTYWYRVSAVTEQGPAPSEVVSATTLPVTPEAPVIVATANGIAVEVGWTDVAGESAYRIERWSNVTGGWVVIGTVGQDVTSYVDGALEPGVTYDYRVVATNESGESPASNVASATTSAVDGTSVEPAPSAGDVLPEPEVSD
ncbi:MAG TPA: fibronectin type III domain-containing protein, partial [Actinomycetota bacterium]|nr:fibronectin type III domain-containing protein [Actinomycetota bacterium]